MESLIRRCSVKGIDARPNDRSFRSSLALLLCVVLAFYFLAMAGLASSADAFAFLFVVAMGFPAYRVPLLLIAAAIQDAPGLSYFWSYVLFASISALIVLQYVADRFGTITKRRSNRYDKAMFYLWLIALIVVFYSICVSWAQDNLGGYPQSERRPYPVVGGLMCLMITVGYMSARDALERPDGLKLLGAAALLAVTHSLLIGLIQIPLGPEFYRSAGNLARVLEMGQLTDAGAFGFARINGPFLSPNAFGFSILLCCLVAIVASVHDWKMLVIRSFLLFGFAAVVLSASKALAAFYVVFGCILYWTSVSRVRFVLYSVVAIIGLISLLSTQYGELLVAAFRIGGGLGAREVAWTAVVQNLSFTDWTFGIGLSAWPEFFGQNAGFELSDPHSVILSVPGTFGLAGILLYLCILVVLAEKYFSGNGNTGSRIAILGMLTLLLGKDLASIPTLLGNTPLTYLVWLCLTLTILMPARKSAREQQQLPPAANPLASNASTLIGIEDVRR